MRRAMVAALVLAAIMAFVVLAPSSEAAEATDPTLQEKYPDADIIIAEGKQGWIHVLTKTSDVPEYSVKEVRSGSSLRVSDLTRLSGNIKVVMDSGKLRELTIVNVDRVLKNIEPIDVKFVMVSGEVNSVTAVSVPQSLVSSLPDSHFTAYNPIASLDIILMGDIGEFSTADALLHIGDVSLTVADGTIDRLYPSGEDGYYDDLHLNVNGGRIGYISNQRAVVGDLDYDLRMGSIDYLCLGSDTDGGSGYYRSNLWTFYVQRSASITIESYVTIGSVILGGGIMSAPTVLCNGEPPEVTLSRNIVIDAPDRLIVAQTCFVVSESRVLRLGSYTLDSTPANADIRTSYYVSYQRNDIYGGNGVWPSYVGGVVPGSTHLYISCDLQIPEGSTLDAIAGSGIVNSGTMILYGELVASGTVTNNGIIEKRSNGGVTGTVAGDGMVAVCIYARPNEGAVNVMTVTDSAIIMRSSSGEIYFNSATMRFNSINVVINITSPESMYIGGSKFVASMKELDRGSHDRVWEVYMSGFSSSSWTFDAEITVPLSISSDRQPVVTDSEGNRLEVVSYTYKSVTFSASGNGTYYFDTELIDSGSDSLGLMINIAIAIAIVIVAGAAVYSLLRRD